MARHVFMTGFPGFIAKWLIDRLLKKDAGVGFTFLIEARLRGVAEAAVAELAVGHPGLADRVRLLEGDISRTTLGLSKEDYQAETARTTHAWHLAAIYNLAVPASLAYRVNVVGTANVLDFCEACPGLERLDYISTCYVSGTRTGLVLENELDEDQGFKNHYEATKCWAELEVRRRMYRLPIVIHRPAVVVGSSHSGETDKYDGPYFVINLLLKVPSWLPMVNIGEGKARVNLVPIDFLVDAMAEIWVKPEAIGQTIHLADPAPHTSAEIMAGILNNLGFRRPLASVPSLLIERALSIGPLRELVKIPPETVTYFNHEVEHDTTNQRRLLQDTGVSCPDFLSILPVLSSYVRQHPDKPFLDGRTF